MAKLRAMGRTRDCKYGFFAVQERFFEVLQELAEFRQIVGKLETETRCLAFRDVWYPAHRRLLVFVKHLGVNLRGIQKPMS